MRRVHIAQLAAVSSIALASCAPIMEQPKDYMLTCLHETGAEGSYVRSFDRIGANGLAKILPAEGGNARGAVLMDACVERYHKQAGTLPSVSVAKEPAMMSNGKLSVPQGYSLSDADVALWKTLTLPQQKRALAFLKSGSTIQSSLLED